MRLLLDSHRDLRAGDKVLVCDLIFKCHPRNGYSRFEKGEEQFDLPNAAVDEILELHRVERTDKEVVTSVRVCLGGGISDLPDEWKDKYVKITLDENQEEAE